MYCMHAGAPRDSVPSPQSALHATAQPSMRQLHLACTLARTGGRSSGRAVGRGRARAVPLPRFQPRQRGVF